MWQGDDFFFINTGLRNMFLNEEVYLECARNGESFTSGIFYT